MKNGKKRLIDRHTHTDTNAEMNTVNPLINARGVYLIFEIFKGAFIRGRRLKEGGVYFKIK